MGRDKGDPMNKRIYVLAVLALAACEAAPVGVKVTAAEYGDRWPLKADAAWLDCDRPNIAFIEVDNVRYALNGKALSAGLPRNDPLRKDPNIYDLADFNERAFDVCKRKFGV